MIVCQSTWFGLRFGLVFNLTRNTPISACSIMCMGFLTWVDLVILDMLDLYIIQGMTQLSPYHDVLNYKEKTMTLDMPGMDKFEWEGVYNSKPIKIIFFYLSYEASWEGVECYYRGPFY